MNLTEPDPAAGATEPFRDPDELSLGVKEPVVERPMSERRRRRLADEQQHWHDFIRIIGKVLESA